MVTRRKDSAALATVTEALRQRTWGMRTALPWALVCLAACTGDARATPPVQIAGPVVIELFTSQGCSSCPPADRLLHELGEDPRVLPLAFHVDYWDDLGWRDTFSSPRWSARQLRYTSPWRGSYTPQLVVGGTRDLVGSDADGARAAIERATASAGAKVELRVERRGEHIVASGTAAAPGDARVVVVLYQRGLETTIERGENAGLKQRYDYVVRDLVERPVGAFTVELTAPRGAPASSLGVVAFVQATRDNAILTARRESQDPRSR